MFGPERCRTTLRGRESALATLRFGLLCLVACSAFLIFPSAGRAQLQSGESTRSRFLIKKWSTEEGLPQNTVTSIVQTRDGYIWAGTFGGLARFDGIRFSVFDSANMPNFTSNRVLSLFEDSHGTLWIGAETGEVYTLRNLKLEEFRSNADYQRKTVWSFEQDAAGNLLIASDSGLERVGLDPSGVPDPNSVRILSRELSYGLCKDPSGKIWVKIFTHYFALENDDLISASTKGLELPNGIIQMKFADDGRAFAGAYGSLGTSDAGGYSQILKLDGRVNNGGFSLAVNDGKMWFQQAGELVEVTDSAVVHHDLKGTVTGGSRAMLFDNEGNLWIATQFDGLVRLTSRKIALMSDSTDLEIAGILTLAEDKNGSIWFGARNLFKLQDGIVSKFSQAESNNEFQVVRSIAFAPDGTIWTGGTLGLHRFENGRAILDPRFASTQVHALFFDRVGSLWIGSSNGLDRMKGDELEHFSTADGLVNDNVHYITQTKDDTIWIGTFQGISKFKDGTFNNITVENGLPTGYVRDVLEDDDGTKWIATYGGGIVRLRDEEMKAIRRSEGLPNNFISRILRSGDKFWILSNLGIFAVDRSELNAVADGLKAILIGSSLGAADGMPSSEANGGHQGAGIKASDGRLFFPMLKDIVIVDPVTPNPAPPRVAIEGAVSQTKSESKNITSTLFDVRNIFQLQDDGRNLEIEYTGLSFTKPEELRFFYKLEGLEEQWTDAGHRRTAFYPYLPAGNYTFQVKAVNSSGQWSESAAALRINVVQRFWETSWFLAVLTVVLFAACAWIFLVRYRRLAEGHRIRHEFSRRLINAHEVERQRMATELHDGLGHNLLLIKNWALLAKDDESVTPEVMDYLSKISGTAKDSIEEARTIVQDLSPQNLSLFGLTDALLNMIDQIQDATGVVFEKKIENIDGRLPKEFEIGVYRIVQECLNNIVKHSGSPKAKVDISFENKALLIVIEDYGKGFTVSERGVLGNNKEGIGLFGISERVRSIGGELKISSNPGYGTKVRIRLDG